jgi:hypothetical protein
MLAQGFHKVVAFVPRSHICSTSPSFSEFQDCRVTIRHRSLPNRLLRRHPCQITLNGHLRCKEPRRPTSCRTMWLRRRRTSMALFLNPTLITRRHMPKLCPADGRFESAAQLSPAVTWRPPLKTHPRPRLSQRGAFGCHHAGSPEPGPVGSRKTIKPRRAVIRADAPGPVDDETRPLSPPSPPSPSPG